MDSQYGLAIWAYSYGRNRQEIIKGWAGVRGDFNFRILLVMYFYSSIFRAYQLIISDLLLEFYYNDYLFNYHIITYFIYWLCVTKGTISVFWLTGLTDTQGYWFLKASIFNIHINISVWDFIYLSIIAVKFCNIWKVLNKKYMICADEFCPKVAKFFVKVFFKLCVIDRLYWQGQFSQWYL